MRCARPVCPRCQSRRVIRNGHIHNVSGYITYTSDSGGDIALTRSGRAGLEVSNSKARQAAVVTERNLAEPGLSPIRMLMPMQEPELLNGVSLVHQAGHKVLEGELVRIQPFKRHDFE